MVNENSTILPTTYLNFRDINVGIVLVGIYFLFDFGTFQGVFEIVNKLKLPFIVALLSVIYVLYLIANHRIDFSGLTTKSFIILCLFLIIYAQISTINSQGASAILTLFIQYLANYLIIITCVKKPSQFILLINIWLFGILHSSYHAIYQGGRVFDSIWLRDENHISLVTAYAIPFAFFLFMSYKSKLKKMFYAVCLGFYATAVVVSVSRGGFLAMISVAFLCWLFIKNKIRVLMLIVLAAILIFTYAPAKFFYEVQTILLGTEEATANERVYSWKMAYMMFKDYPIMGLGAMNYPDFFREYDYEDRFGASRGRRAFQGRAAHSTPMQWLAEFGIVGSIILIILQIAMYRNWKTIYTNKDKIHSKVIENDYMVFKYITNACAISQVGFWVAALFISLLPYPFYWCLIPFSEAWKNIYLEHIKEYNEEILQ